MQKITPCLWFDSQAEEAVHFYVSVFKNAKINQTSYYDEASAKVSGRPKGSVLTMDFSIEDQEFTALNGGPVFQLTPAISFVVSCNDQTEVDYYWEKLSAVKEAEQCGWLQDKYGVSWQIVPVQLVKLLGDADAAKSQRVMKAMLTMTKLDIAKLEDAYRG